MISGDPLSQNPAGGTVPGSTKGPVPVIRLFGSTMAGDSVLAYVHGFTPYFFALPPVSVELSDKFLADVRASLDQKVGHESPETGIEILRILQLKDRARGDEKKLAWSVLAVDREVQKESLLGYHHGKLRDFLKVSRNDSCPMVMSYMYL